MSVTSLSIMARRGSQAAGRAMSLGFQPAPDRRMSSAEQSIEWSNPFGHTAFHHASHSSGSTGDANVAPGIAPAPLQRKFKSARLIGEYEKPWLETKDRRKTWDKLIFGAFCIVGIVVGFWLIYSGWNSVDNPPYCLVFQDDFSNGINENDWNYEQQLGGFGTGSFDWTTNNEQNIYTDSDGLHIIPTLTSNSSNITVDEIINGYTVNLTAAGVCTGTTDLDCARVSNSSTGEIINPVQSARLTTKGKHSILYGKVEVTAKLPVGDWLWPAIWMMPETDTYGIWPASGEIDIVESKGNDGLLYAGGNNEISGTLHWGPASILDAFWRTAGVRYLRRTTYSAAYHTYGMEWSPSYIYTWVDTRLKHSMYTPFGGKQGMMFTRGQFAQAAVNGSVPTDPWSQTGRWNTPFDQAFYLILNVAVGGTNGYFRDGYGGKPWVDQSKVAAGSFLRARGEWEGSWGGDGDGGRGLGVRSVKMFTRGSCK